MELSECFHGFKDVFNEDLRHFEGDEMAAIVQDSDTEEVGVLGPYHVWRLIEQLVFSLECPSWDCRIISGRNNNIRLPDNAIHVIKVTNLTPSLFNGRHSSYLERIMEIL